MNILVSNQSEKQNNTQIVNEVWYYKVDNLGHDIPSKYEHGIRTSELFWELLVKFVNEKI